MGVIMILNKYYSQLAPPAAPKLKHKEAPKYKIPVSPKLKNKDKIPPAPKLKHKEAPKIA